jgi:D-alanyl-D-alanine carboxypeptidase
MIKTMIFNGKILINYFIILGKKSKTIQKLRYKGLKTGFTIPAGFCLSSWY